MSRAVGSDDFLAVATALVWTVSLSVTGFRGWTTRACRLSPRSTFGRATVSTEGQTTELPSQDVFGEIYRRQAPGSSAADSGVGLKCLLSLFADTDGVELSASNDSVAGDSSALNVLEELQSLQTLVASPRELSDAANGCLQCGQAPGSYSTTSSAAGGVHVDAVSPAVDPAKSSVRRSLDAVARVTITSPSKTKRNSSSAGHSSSATCSTTNSALSSSSNSTFSCRSGANMADEAPTASMSEVSAFELVRSNQAFCDYIKGIHTDRGATLKPDSSTRSDAAYQQYQKQHQQLHSHDLGAAAEPFALAADSSALGPQISPVAATAVSAPVHELDCAALQIVRNASSCGGGGGSSSTGAILLPRGPISTSDPGSATAALAAAAFALAAAAAQHRSLGGAVASQSPPPVQGFDMCRVRCNISFIPEDEEVDAASDGEEREEDLREMGVLAADVADTDTGSGARTCSGARRSAASRGQSVCEGVYELRRLLLPAAVPTTPQHSSAQRALYTQQEREHVSAQQGLPAGAGAVVSADSVESVCVMQESILPTESASSVSSSSSVSSAPELRLADSADLHEAYKCHASMVNLCGGEESCAGYEEQRGFQGPCRDVVTSNCGADSCEREAGAAFSCGSCEMDESSCGEPAPMTPSRQHPHLPVCSPCGKTELLVAAGADTAATAAAALSVAADAALVPAVEAGFEVEEEDGNIITYPLGPGCEPSMLLHYSSSPEAAPHGSMLALSAGPSPRSFPVGSPLRDSPARQPQPCPSGLSAAALSSASFLHAASVRSRRTSAPRSAPTSSGGAMADFPLTVPDLSRGVPAPVPEHPASTGPSSSTSIHVDMLHTSHDPPELPVDPSASSFSQLGMPVPLAPALSMARTSTRYRRSTAGGSTSTASSSAVCTPRSVASTTALYGARGGSQGGSVRQRHRVAPPPCLSHPSRPHPKHVHVVGTQNASLHTLHNHSTTLKAIAAAGTPAALAAAACASLELCRRRQAREQLVQQAAATLCGGADCPSYLRPTLSSAAKSLLLQHQPPPPHPPPYRPSVTAGPTPTRSMGPAIERPFR